MAGEPKDGRSEGRPSAKTERLTQAAEERAQSSAVVDDPTSAEAATARWGGRRPRSKTELLKAEGPSVQDTMDRALLPADGPIVSHGELARGGMGIIERIDDRVLLRQAALKVLRHECRLEDDAVRAFVREAQITGQLDHPNVVPIYHLGNTDDRRPCFSMKLVQGRTLSSIIDELPRGPLARGRLLDLIDVILRVCDALAFAHSRGVVHCDVKPGNVMVADYGQVYLMDWGIAQLVDVQPPPVVAPVTCSVDEGDGDPVRGTASSMAPEQAAGDPVDPRTDVFAVGALLYGVLCRRPPYAIRDPETALLQAIRCDFLRPSAVADGIGTELERIVLKAMAHDPADRYPSIPQLQQDLVRFVRGGGDFPRIEYAAGACVVGEGDVGDAAFIIEQGRCAVLKQIDGKSVKLREMGPGEVFGETAILAASPRTASVVTLEPTVLLMVTRSVLEQEMGAMKPWMSAFIQTLARRFRERESSR